MRDEQPPSATGDIKEPRWNAWVGLGLVAGWLLLATVGPMFELAYGVSAWYPPAALSAAALLIWRGRAFGTLVLASAIHVLLVGTDGDPFWRVLLVVTGKRAIYWGAAELLRHLRVDLRFPRPTDVALFALAFGAAGLLSGLVAVYDLLALGRIQPAEFLSLVRAFWIGDVVAVLTLAPALVLLFAWLGGDRVDLPSMRAAWRRGRHRAQFASVPLAILVAVALSHTLGFFAYVLCFFPLGWIAAEHGARAAALGNVLLVGGTLVSAVVLGHTAPSHEVQAFTAMLTLTGLMIGSVASEREQANRGLARSEARYRRLVDLLPDPVVVHAEGRVLLANEAAATVLGTGTPEALVGRSLTELAAPGSQDLVHQRINQLASGHGVPLVHHRFVRADGTGIVDLEAVSIPFTYQERRAALTVARDVTARLRLEGELRDVQRMEAIGRLAGGVAHDFNNLLTVILSYCQLLREEPTLSDTAVREVGEIRAAAQRAADLTRQLLAFSRREVPQPQPVAVNDAIAHTEGMLRRLVGVQVPIESALDPAVGLVLVDPGQLDQVIMNLVVNARDAMPSGGRVTITTRRVAAGEEPATARCDARAAHFVSIGVRDTGTGMDEATRARIFDPFFTTKGVGQGTGLGLSTVHGIVAQAGGAIVVESVPGVGTEFRVLLPELVEDDAPPPAPEALGTPEGSARVAPACVLLVDDEAAIRGGLGRTLRRAGYQVIEAADGLEALHVLEERRAEVSVVLSDIAMPRLDGRQLSARIRSRWPELPLVLMTGFVEPAKGRAEGGEVPILQKPFDTAQLLAALDLAARQPADSALAL